jgi:hypothetical protein
LILLAPIALAVGIIVRWLWGFPVCKAEDEFIWAYIFQLRSAGGNPPISGPLFAFLVENLASITGAPYSSALALIGTSILPIVAVMMIWSYAQLKSINIMHTALALSSTTYFWGPFLLSRPQQIGQVCFLIGNVLTWLHLTGRKSWRVLTLFFVFTSLVHILSFALLSASALLTGLIAVRIGKSSTVAVKQLVLPITIGISVILLPGGPYASLIQDIYDQHIRISSSTGFILLASTLILAGLVWFLRNKLILLSRLTRSKIVKVLNDSPKIWILAISISVGLVLVAQAAMLTEENWMPYGNSLPLFLFSQLGNVFYYILTILGLLTIRQLYMRGQSNELLLAFGIFSLVSVILAAVALLLSPFLWNTNWMLRVLNYCVLVFAPIAAMGVMRPRETMPSTLTVLAGISMMVSVLSATRVGFIFNC